MRSKNNLLTYLVHQSLGIDFQFMTSEKKNLDSLLSKWLPFFNKIVLCLFALLINLVILPYSTNAKVESFQNGDEVLLVRSVESLRDLDSQTWQMVAYKEGVLENKSTLRIVGYPGTLRIDHPKALRVQAGLRTWFLDDITLSNEKLAKDPREAAAEFDLTPLLNDLTNNKPLRLNLPGVFAELPIPPYVVGEWRSLNNPDQS